MESDDKHIFRFEIIQVDISVKYLNFFLEDDAELEHIKKVRFLLFG
jgi:tryptophanyl-tRNA synthetase